MTVRIRVSAIVAIGIVFCAITGVAANSGDDDLLKAARIGTDDAELLGYFRRRTVSDSERQRILELIRQLGNDAYAVRERAANDLIEVGLPAVGLLRQGKNDPDIEIARRCERCLQRIESVPTTKLSAAVARTVAKRRPIGSAAVLLAYLPFADDEVVAEELRDTLAAVALRDGRPDPALLAAVDDPVPIRRAAAGEALVRTNVPAALTAARRLLADREADVRLRVALALVTHAKDRQAVRPMIQLLAEVPQSTAWRIEETLIRLAGDAAPTVALGGNEAARQKCRDAWLAWWEKDGEAVDLAKLEGAAPTLGYTLIVARNQSNLSGKVFEVNAAKEILWQIDGLTLPMDAIVIGKDRVLIAEQNAQRVSERDFRGNPVWTKSIPPVRGIQSLPIGLQRLPNGNTLIVCRSHVLEWDAEQRSVGKPYERPQPGQDIVAATKLRNGELIVLTNQGNCIRLDKDGKKLSESSPNGQSFVPFGYIDALPTGNVLVTQQNTIAELDAEGKQVSSLPAIRPTAVQRLSNGNTLIAGGGSTAATANVAVRELDRNGNVAWEYRFTDATIPYRAHRR
jgi:HEAT repeat protein